jgi:hypothetical protein
VEVYGLDREMEWRYRSGAAGRKLEASARAIPFRVSHHVTGVLIAELSVSPRHNLTNIDQLYYFLIEPVNSFEKDHLWLHASRLRVLLISAFNM